MKHKYYFGLSAEWHSHGTTYGKGACGGIRTTLKREVTRYSLQADPIRAILTSEALFFGQRRNSQTCDSFIAVRRFIKGLSSPFIKDFLVRFV